jgi:hypothetical protein
MNSKYFAGGPGSMKGILTQELAQEFDFVTIGIGGPNFIWNLMKK